MIESKVFSRRMANLSNLLTVTCQTKIAVREKLILSS